MNQRRNTYFIADMHLGAPYITDPRAHEQRVCGWLEEIKDDARRIYMLGDVLDYWYEYRDVVPRGHVRFFGKLAELSDAGVEIIWLIGNHDIWIFDYLPNELGIKVVDGPIEVDLDGTRFYLAHGDALGSLKPGFKLIRKIFRNRLCQHLYASLHPRLTVPFARKWSAHSRVGGESYSHWLGDDIEPSWQFAQSYAATHPEVRYIILGHRHLEVNRAISPTQRLIILGDWINGKSSAKWDGNTLTTSFENYNLSE